ncbi:MAG: glycosyltransferase family 39 protein [Chloroflexi bacterium]|nr:glycosyltransferase family 39 protein [Chloroflexota bacterium]
MLGKLPSSVETWTGTIWYHLSLVLAVSRVSPYLLAVGTLTLVGLSLRLWGIGFGLPYGYHLDEEQYFLDATRFAYSLSFAPESWANPTLLKYLYFLEYRIFYLVGVWTGQFASIADFKQLTQADPTIFYLLSRTTSAIFGALTIPLVYWIGAQSYNKKIGVIAAALLTGAFLHVRDSHYAVSDVPTTFFTSGVLLFCVLYLHQGRARLLYAAAAWAGMAMATKYTAAIMVAPITLVWLWRNFSTDYRQLWLRLWRKELLLAYAIVGVVFLIIVPYALLDWQNFLQSMRDHYGMGKTPGLSGYKIDVESGWLFYLQSLAWGLGYPLLGASLLGLLYAGYRRYPADIILVVTVFLFYVFLARQLMFFARFIIPLVPLLMILAARLIWDASQRIASFNPRVVTVVLTVLVLIQPIIASLRHDWLLGQTDTRTMAKEWIETELPEGSKIFVEWYTPPLSTPDQAAPYSRRTYYVDKSYIVGLFEHTTAEYRQAGYDYLIASSHIYNISRLDPVEQQERQAFYSELGTEFQLIKSFKPYKGDTEPPFIFAQLYGPATDLFQFIRPGPTIKIYKVNNSNK